MKSNLPSAQCGKCKSLLKAKKYLKDHETAHTDIRKHECPRCTHKYKYKRGLIRHIKSKHTLM